MDQATDRLRKRLLVAMGCTFAGGCELPKEEDTGDTSSGTESGGGETGATETGETGTCGYGAELTRDLVESGSYVDYHRFYACRELPPDGSECMDATSIDATRLVNDTVGEHPDSYCNWSPLDVCGPLEEFPDACCYSFTLAVECWDEGRPLTIDGASRRALPASRSDWAAPMIVIPPEDSMLRARLAAEWTDSALAEHASIASFARFVLHLQALGAPPELVIEAIRAMSDEVSHARLAFGIASAMAGRPVGPGPVPVEGALRESGPSAIVRAAVREGCVNETVSAALAAKAAGAATDPAIRRALERIAADEERHAALAWRFVKWALGRFPALVPAVVEELERATDAPLPSPALDGADLCAWGRLPDAERRAIAHRTLEQVVRPCAEALARTRAGAAA